MTTTPNPGPTRTPRGFGIDSRIGAAALRAPAASMEDSCPRAILKFQPRNSFDYRVHYEPQLRSNLTASLMANLTANLLMANLTDNLMANLTTKLHTKLPAKLT